MEFISKGSLTLISKEEALRIYSIFIRVGTTRRKSKSAYFGLKNNGKMVCFVRVFKGDDDNLYMEHERREKGKIITTPASRIEKDTFDEQVLFAASAVNDYLQFMVEQFPDLRAQIVV